ncbi:MAG TPA: glucose 1-dehydrogenase [Vicinamibacterales bacterium]|jgi:NAD(P)-dependent dehydrogenase (short-subunit alcohol dehydrogenase family)
MRAIVTGATSGIGQAVARRFACEGAALALVGRDTAALEAIKAELAGRGCKALAIVSDVTASDAPARIVGAAVDMFGGLDALVNAAGVFAGGTMQATDDAVWNTMLDVNLSAPFRLMREAARHLAASRGAIVNVSSVAGARSFPGVLAYCVSKAALDQLTRCAALELAPEQVRVNAVNPGVVVTNLHRRSGMSEDVYAAFLERAKETHPLGRAGSPGEIAELIYFLCSEKSAWITGETISIDGGRHLTCLR